VLVNRLGSNEQGSTLWYFLRKDTAFGGNNVPVGYPTEDNAVRIVDDDGNDVNDGAIGEIVACAPHPDHATSAHHRDSGGFIRQPRRIGQKHAFAEIRDIEGIGEVGHHAFEQLLGAFLHQARIGTEHQRHAQCLGRVGGEAIGFLSLDDHLRRLKNTPRSMRMRSARSSPARRSESCCAARVE